MYNKHPISYKIGVYTMFFLRWELYQCCFERGVMVWYLEKGENLGVKTPLHFTQQL